MTKFSFLKGQSGFSVESAMKKNGFLVNTFTISLLIILLVGQGLGVFLFILLAQGGLIDQLNEKIVFLALYQGVLLIITLLLVTAFFNRTIKSPLSDLNAAVNDVDAGNLTIILQPAKNPGIAALITGFNSLTTHLKNILKKLFSTTNNVTTAIEQINLIIDRVTKGTHNQVEATKAVLSAMEDADKSQKEILESTRNLGEFSEENFSSLVQINATSEEITESSEQLFQASSDAYSTIAEISSAAKSIAKSTEELSTSTEEITASIEQVSANIKEVENNTRESASQTELVKEIASDTGMINVADAMEGMEEIIDSVDRTLELVNNLKTKSGDVEKVLTVIDDVTKQTNVLSVNAAILAAQAGEYGKGFSVVANEIKTLAGRTASSAKEITGIIESIQNGITEAMLVTENSKIKVTNGNALVVKTGEGFREVITSAQKSAEMAKTIRNATEEQVKGIVQMKESMDMILLMVEHVTKSTREHERGSEHLVSVTERVKDVSEAIKRGMKEQTAGIHLISKNLELTNTRIKQIADVASKHGKVNEDVLSAVQKIEGICNSTIIIAEEMSVSFNTLLQESEILRREMKGFKFE
ncbi:MAG: methyl-accepting chemotaxis protein [Candidatus Mariimomonas ferrooxydans]